MAFEEPIAREEYAFLAKLAEQAERYDEMAELMHKCALGTSSLEELTVEESSLLSIAYKNLVRSHRDALQVVSSIAMKEEQLYWPRTGIVKDYRARVEADLASICWRFLGLLDTHFNPSACSRDTKIFFLKIKADYHRYLAEFKVGWERRMDAEKALMAYREAQDIARADLGPAHPLRLGVALNFSVFFYEILESTIEACRMAKEAFEDAIPEVESLDEASSKDSKIIMHDLQGNLNLWSS